MNSDAADKTSGYKIGMVSRMTGISAETLRIWERRYDTVTPGRTETGDRLYDADDIARLRLIKQLVDRGDSIGSVASLPEQVLQARVEAETLLEHCQALAGRVASTSSNETSADIASTVPAPARRYNDETLARIAAISPNRQV